LAIRFIFDVAQRALFGQNLSMVAGPSSGLTLETSAMRGDLRQSRPAFMCIRTLFGNAPTLLIATVLVIWSSGVYSQQTQRAPRIPSAVVPNAEPAPAPPGDARELVQIPLEDLARFARLEGEILKLQKENDELRGQSAPDSKPSPGVAPNIRSVRQLFEQIAKDFGATVQGELFCSTARAHVDDNLIVRITGTVRDQSDLEKARSLIERNVLSSLFNNAKLLSIDIKVDGGRAGGCVLVLANSNLSIAKENRDAFRLITASVLKNQKQMMSLVPDKSRCAEIGHLIMRLREDGAQVPVRQKNLFSSFWVRDNEQLTLCREDGQEWRAAASYLVKDGWAGLLILPRSE
jgi:hypothetical protein